MLRIVVRNMKYKGVSEELALSSFLEVGLDIFLRNRVTNFTDYTLL
jgi:hypothetical protein